MRDAPPARGHISIEFCVLGVDSEDLVMNMQQYAARLFDCVVILFDDTDEDKRVAAEAEAISERRDGRPPDIDRP